MKQVKEELDKERAEVARLKSLEQVRLRKLGEKKKDMVERLKQEKRELDRERAKLEQEAKQRKLKEWELMEQRKAKEAKIIDLPMKVLEDDYGCEQVSRSYHIAHTMH